MTLALSTTGISKRYGAVQALAGVDLEVEQGEIFGFLGPNGAGKTTFTKCVTGFVRPDAGQIHVFGIDAQRNSRQVNQRIGLVPDQYDFYQNFTGRQHLDFYGRLHGMEERHRRERIDQVLEMVRMEERADTRVNGYSHGMKQRICIAQAMLHEPDLIFFDEPTNGLDPKGAYELREMIRGLSRDGTTVFLNSHQLHEVEQVCQRVAILHRGTIRTVASVAELRMQHGGEGVSMRLLSPAKQHIAAAERVLGKAPRQEGDRLLFNADETTTAEVVQALAEKGARIVEVDRHDASLESVFLALTEDEPAPQTTEEPA